MKPTETPLSLESLVALCKRRGFVYPAADIYGGINGIYDIGHLGVLMKRNIRNIWISSLNNPLGPVVELEGSLLAPEAVWKASGARREPSSSIIFLPNKSGIWAITETAPATT